MLQSVLLLLFTMLLPIGLCIRQLLPGMTQEEQREAAEQIWRQLSARLRRFVRSRIESTADVDDVLQTVFLRIHYRLSDWTSFPTVRPLRK